MRALVSLSLLVPALALAAPVEIAHQGRLLDADGLPLEGSQNITFALYDAASSGDVLWQDTFALTLDSGYFSATLGSGAALDDEAFAGGSVWLGIKVGTGAELPQRLAIQNVPYAVRARHAESATNLTGGTVDATHIQINGVPVFDSNGNPTGDVDWSQITGAPEVTNPLEDLGCNADEHPRFDGSAWTCGSDADLSIAAEQVTGTLSIAQLPVGPSAGKVMPGDKTFTAADVGALPIGGGTLTGDLGGTAATFSAGVNAANLTASGEVKGATLTATGAANAASVTASGEIKGATFTATGAASAASVSATGEVKGATVTATGVVSGASGAFTSGVRVGTAADNGCNSGAAGTVRIKNAVLQYCDGSGWRSLESQGTGVGDSAQNPAASCRAIKQANSSAPSGVYWVDHDGSGSQLPRNVYCEMTIANGGWTLMAHFINDRTAGNPINLPMNDCEDGDTKCIERNMFSAGQASDLLVLDKANLNRWAWTTRSAGSPAAGIIDLMTTGVGWNSTHGTTTWQYYDGQSRSANTHHQDNGWMIDPSPWNNCTADNNSNVGSLCLACIRADSYCVGTPVDFMVFVR